MAALPDGVRVELESIQSAGGLVHLQEVQGQIKVRGEGAPLPLHLQGVLCCGREEWADVLGVRLGKHEAMLHRDAQFALLLALPLATSLLLRTPLPLPLSLSLPPARSCAARALRRWMRWRLSWRRRRRRMQTCGEAGLHPAGATASMTVLRIPAR